MKFDLGILYIILLFHFLPRILAQSLLALAMCNSVGSESLPERTRGSSDLSALKNRDQRAGVCCTSAAQSFLLTSCCTRWARVCVWITTCSSMQKPGSCPTKSASTKSQPCGPGHRYRGPLGPSANSIALRKETGVRRNLVRYFLRVKSCQRLCFKW